MSISSNQKIDNYLKCVMALNDLNALESIKSADAKSIWSKLSSQGRYLVASRHHPNNFSWGLTSEFKMMKNFEYALEKNENPEKIKKAILEATEDQTKILSLRKLKAIINDPNKSHKEKVEAYREIEKANYPFFDQIKHSIWIAHGKDENAGLGFSDTKIDNEPASKTQLDVVKTMLKVLKKGYTDFKKHEGLFLAIKQ